MSKNQTVSFFDTFADKTVYDRIAEAAGLRIQNGKAKQITRPFSYYMSVAVALFLIWSMTVVSGVMLIQIYNSPAAKLKRQI